MTLTSAPTPSSQSTCSVSLAFLSSVLSVTYVGLSCPCIIIPRCILTNAFKAGAFSYRPNHFLEHLDTPQPEDTEVARRLG